MSERVAANNPLVDRHVGGDSRIKAIPCDGGSRSVRNVAKRAAAVAAALAQLGVRRKERVLILMPDGPGFVEALVGAMQQGAVALPLNPVVSVKDVVVTTADAGAHLVVASAERIHALAGLAAEPPVLVGGLKGPWAAALRLLPS